MSNCPLYSLDTNDLTLPSCVLIYSTCVTWKDGLVTHSEWPDTILGTENTKTKKREK